MPFRPLMIALAAVSACLAAGACAVPADDRRLAAGARCEDVVGEGMGQTRKRAQFLAKEGVRHQLADARGNLLRSGLRGVRAEGADVRCRPHTLGLGLINCTAVARLCGH